MDLIEAVKRNDVESVKAIITGGVDLNALDEHRWSALSWASFEGFVECAKVLLEAKADTENADRRVCVPLYAASSSGRLDCLKLLIAHGSNINARSASVSSPLHAAAINGHFECMEELIRFGAQVDEQNKFGYTPLAYAIDSKHGVVCVERLLDAGAKISNINKTIQIPDWFTPLVNQRKRVKEALKVLFVLTRPHIGKDVAKILITMVWETRNSPQWE